MFNKLIIAAVATASIAMATIGTAEARDRDHRRHHRGGANVNIDFGGFGGGYYGNRFGRGYGYDNYGQNFYGGDYGYGRRHRYVYDDYGPECGVRRVNVKKWNRSHTRYSIVRKRVTVC